MKKPWKASDVDFAWNGSSWQRIPNKFYTEE